MHTHKQLRGAGRQNTNVTQPLQPDCDDDTSGICSAMQFCRQPSVCGVFFAQWPQKCPLLRLHAFSDATITACARACVPRHKLARYFWMNYNFMHYCVSRRLGRMHDHRCSTRYIEGAPSSRIMGLICIQNPRLYTTVRKGSRGRGAVFNGKWVP